MHQRIAINSNKNNIIYFSETIIENGFLTTLHSHPNLEVLLITKGEGHIITTNRKMAIKKNDIVVINPNSKHCEIGEGLSFYAIGIASVDIYLKETFTKKIIIRNLKNELYTEIRAIYELIFREALINDIKSIDILTNAYEIMFNLLDREFDITKLDNSSTNESDLVTNIKSIIDSHYSSDIKLDEIAHRLSLSTSTICHAFKKETGQSIIDYKIAKQIEEATNLLEISDMSISDIGSIIGFNDTSYFIKIFKKKLGVTPKEYKEKKPTA